MLSARGSASPAISWMVGVSLKGCHSSIKNGIQVWQQFNRKTQPDWNDCTAVSMIFMTPPNPRSSMHCGLVLSMFMRDSMLYSGYWKKRLWALIIEVGPKKREGLCICYLLVKQVKLTAAPCCLIFWKYFGLNVLEPAAKIWLAFASPLPDYNVDNSRVYCLQ